MKINFGKSNPIGSGTNSDIDTSEEDVVSITDLTYLGNTQFTAYFSYDLGTHTSIELRFYVRASNTGDWYQLPVKNEATGVLVDIPSVLNSTSPAVRVVEEFPIPACFGFKITAQGVGGANGSVTATLLQRSN